MGGFYQNGRGCQEGMRTEISSGEEALKGPLKALLTLLVFGEVKSFPATLPFPLPEQKARHSPLKSFRLIFIKRDIGSSEKHRSNHIGGLKLSWRVLRWLRNRHFLST
jgi:hypothetical protein